ncbi:ATP synthase subunit C lysine N-methyltransferase [Dirofilaria immitis]
MIISRRWGEWIGGLVAVRRDDLWYVMKKEDSVIFSRKSELIEASENAICNSRVKFLRHQMGLAGMIAAGMMTTSAVAVTALCVPFITPALRKICIPYVPATPQQLQNVATALSICPTKVSPLVDLGSGDGRVIKLFDLLVNELMLRVFISSSTNKLHYEKNIAEKQFFPNNSLQSLDFFNFYIVQYRTLND